jgi:hypothetical protein
MGTQNRTGEADIREQIDRWTEAVRAMDLEAVMSIYAPNIVFLAMVFASCCHLGAAEPSTRRCVDQPVMKFASTERGDKSRPVVCTDGSWRSFARSFSDEPEIKQIRNKWMNPR